MQEHSFAQKHVNIWYLDGFLCYGTSSRRCEKTFIWGS